MTIGMADQEILLSSWSATHEGGGCLCSPCVYVCWRAWDATWNLTSLSHHTPPLNMFSRSTAEQGSAGPSLCSPPKEMAILGAPHVLHGGCEYDA